MLCVGVAILCAIAIVIAFLVGWEEFKKGGGGGGGNGGDAARGDDYHRGDGVYGGTPVGVFWKYRRDGGGVEAAGMPGEEVPLVTRDVEVEVEMEGNEVVAVAGDDYAFMGEVPVTEVPIVGRAACGDECEDEEEKKPKGLPPWGGPGDYLGR